MSVSALSTGVDKRDGGECIIDGCGYDITEYLDHCHIVDREARKTVRPHSTPLSLYLSHLFHLVANFRRAQFHSEDEQMDCAEVPAQWALDV